MPYTWGVRWPWQRQPKAELISISDPAAAFFFGVLPTDAGINVGEGTALGLSAVWRSVALISQTIASLPARTYRDTGDGHREQVGSFLDDPARVLPDGPTPFEFWETVLAHMLVHGNAFLAHIFNAGGGLAGLLPIHPLLVSIDKPRQRPAGQPDFAWSREYKLTLDDGTQKTFTPATMTHIPALSMDGMRGLSPISVARNSLATAVAGDRAAGRMFRNGALMSGMVTPEEDVTEEEARQIKASLADKVAGVDNAGEIAVINRKLKFTPWTMSLEDAQFLQSRQFQIEEIARWYGIPPFALMQTEKQTSWGTGIESQQRGLGRTVLSPWAVRIQQRMSRLLARPRFFEFDFAGLERATPAEEIRLLIEQVRGGLLTVNEARRIRNLEPVAGGDTLAEPKGTATPPKPDDAEGVSG